MTPGGVIACVAAGAFVAAVFYGLFHDVARWWERARDERDYRRLAAQFREREEIELLWSMPAKEPKRWTR